MCLVSALPGPISLPFPTAFRLALMPKLPSPPALPPSRLQQLGNLFVAASWKPPIISMADNPPTCTVGVIRWGLSSARTSSSTPTYSRDSATHCAGRLCDADLRVNQQMQPRSPVPQRGHGKQAAMHSLQNTLVAVVLLLVRSESWLLTTLFPLVDGRGYDTWLHSIPPQMLSVKSRLKFYSVEFDDV